ncbi:MULTISPECIES: GntR family transcriptional regulator [unclassified Oceanispirochaeta]|uniref:GntR family transcriptional regulator n=1 Tax=unclassified Oceanispirochaeta TaxID=2635722 RepID=UPI000E096944|nr:MULTISPECIES: GntR family transcriptional regulator [unclassified Oceanispirochaeta]MBF9014576.1 GntR family transcriptional regulator [Oceanispirochaeta sp. M2]NPD70832.1 GntR family transcriptional regulator [Oceanispirochaeta sp. M1]RDG34114.1 GntR family transcriptional regulator [Oceanispirochaeta sp. M1]
MKNEPMYLNVYRILVKRIEGGIYQTDELLPPEPVLQEEFQVSRTTIRKAMEMLTRDSYVIIKQGKGTRVLDRQAMSQQLNYVSSFSETLRKKGCTVSIDSIEFEKISADESMAGELEIEEGHELFLLKRVVLSNEKPIAIVKNYLIPRFVPGLPNDFKTITSLYQYIEQKWGITIESALDRITARSADEHEAAILGLEDRAPLLIDHRLTRTMGTPFELVYLIIDASSYEFSIFMKGRID